MPLQIPNSFSYVAIGLSIVVAVIALITNTIGLTLFCVQLGHIIGNKNLKEVTDDLQWFITGLSFSLLCLLLSIICLGVQVAGFRKSRNIDKWKVPLILIALLMVILHLAVIAMNSIEIYKSSEIINFFNGQIVQYICPMLENGQVCKNFVVGSWLMLGGASATILAAVVLLFIAVLQLVSASTQNKTYIRIN